MQTIEKDPFARQTFAQRMQNLAEVVTHLEENYPDLDIIRAETINDGRDQVHIFEGSSVIRSLGPVTMRAQTSSHIRLETKFKGVTIFTLTESYAP